MPILDNFGSQFINDASALENGLMSSHDKMKLDSILLSDIDYISEGLEKIEDYMTPQVIYGIKIDTSSYNPDDYVTYTDDAVTFTPLKVDTSTGVCDYGSWKEIINTLIGAKPCLVNNSGTVLFYLNPDNYNQLETGETIDIESGEFGQVMIRFNHLYYKFSMEGTAIKFQISNKKVDETWIDTAFASEDGIGQSKDYMFISAYETCLKNNKLQSLSNQSIKVNIPYSDMERLSEFGVFHMMNIVKKQFVIFLGYLVTKSIDLSGNIGPGYTYDSIDDLKSGSMNDKGLFYGSENNNGVKLFGIENLWGHRLKYMHGIIQRLTYVINTETGMMEPEQHLFVKEFYPYDNINDYTDCGKIEPNKYGYIKSLKFVTNSIYFPDSLEGSSASYYKSYFQNGESTEERRELYGIYGSNDNDIDLGQEFMLLGYINSDNDYASTHLIY